MVGKVREVLFVLLFCDQALRDVAFHDALVDDLVSQSCHRAECKFALPTVNWRSVQRLRPIATLLKVDTPSVTPDPEMVLRGVPPSADQLHELEILIRAHHPLLLVDTVEEERLHVLLEHAAEHTGLPLFSWNQVDGLRRELPDPGQTPESGPPQKALAFIERSNLEAIFHLRGLGPYLHEPVVIAQLKSIHNKYFGHRGALVVSGNGLDLPPAVEHLFTPMHLRAPSPEAYHAFVQAVLRDLANRLHVQVKLSSVDVSKLLAALHGLTFFEVQKIITQAVVEDGVLGREDLAGVLRAKRQIIERSGVLEYFPHDHAMGDIAGLRRPQGLAPQAAGRVRGSRAEPRSTACRRPKGLMLIGVQGCGKSLCAKAVATAWHRPLLRLDPGALYDRYIGESEQRLRAALRQAERMAPIVLWVDEIEKGFASAASRSADGGLSQRMFGTLLTWMQEHDAPVFLVATANDIEALPPELLRKGRFDEIFFVDLPGKAARRQILTIHLRSRKQDPRSFDLDVLVNASDGYSGAEIEQAVRLRALHGVSPSEEELTTASRSLDEIELTRPLSVTMAERIDALYATGPRIARCSPGSSRSASALRGRCSTLPGLTWRALSMNHRHLLRCLVLTTVLTGCSAESENDQPRTLAVQTQLGPVEGVEDDGVFSYRGIPYAAPPVGDLRWQPPVAPEPWTEPLLATDKPAICPQTTFAGLPVPASTRARIASTSTSTRQRWGRTCLSWSGSTEVASRLARAFKPTGEPPATASLGRPEPSSSA